MRKITFREGLAVAVALVAVYVFFIGYNPFAAQQPSAAAGSQAAAAGEETSMQNNKTENQGQTQNAAAAPQGLGVTDTRLGTGAAVQDGDTVTVNYTGMLLNGTKFDSSYDRGQPFTFTVGAGQVIKGWELGLVGMKVGGARRLVIPPELGYGAASVGPIPANSTLVFDIELLGIARGAAGSNGQ